MSNNRKNTLPECVETEGHAQRFNSKVPAIVQHIREQLLRYDQEELAHALNIQVRHVVNMEEKHTHRQRRLEYGFIHQHTKLLQYLQSRIDSPLRSDIDILAIQRAIKSLAIALIKQERRHLDCSQWHKLLTVKDLLRIYPPETVTMIRAAQERIKARRTTKTPNPLPPPSSHAEVSDKALPKLPSDTCIANLLYDYTHSGEIPVNRWDNGYFVLSRDLLTKVLRKTLRIRIQRTLRDALKYHPIDEINMDDIIKQAYKDLVTSTVRWRSSSSSKRYGRTGSCHPNDGIKKNTGE